MSKLSYRTIADERPQGKPNVYFSCHPNDLDKYFEEYSSKILRIQDCAIWYESEPEADYDKDDLELNLSQMQLFVMPVTTKLLTEPCRAMEVELPLAKEKHIPVLPLMMEQGLDEVFSKLFGDLQYLNPGERDETRRSFDEVLETYIKSVLVSNELAEKVRAAFDAYIFLSYRKKDRRKAQELMRLIHRNPLCRNIAIWYDEFLTPGEDFNDAIGKMLEKSDLFALVVTPNLVNEINYVMTTEYPAAVQQEKPVLPVEMEETDRGKLDEHYKSLPPCVKGEESNEFRMALLEKIRTMAVEANDTDPGHNFLIGLAYLDGIDVEVDSERAVELITGAAEAGVPEAMEQLVTMYETGKGVKRDYYEGVRWREKHVEYLRKAYEAKPTRDKVVELISALWNLGDALCALGVLERAAAVYSEAYFLTEQHGRSEGVLFRQGLSISCIKLGDTEKAMGNWAGAQGFYEKSLAIDEELAEKMKTIESKRQLSISYERLGDTAKAMGDLAEAHRYYEKSLAIRVELSEKTGTIESRRDISISYSKIGDTARDTGDLVGAQRYYERGYTVDKELLEKTGTPECGRALCISCNRLGRMAAVLGDLGRAQKYYEEGHAIAEELSEETGTIESKRALSVSCDSLGDIARDMGDLAKAHRYYEKGLAIRKELSVKSGTIELKRDLSISYNKLGDIVIAMGDFAGAQVYYEKGLVVREELAEKTGTIESKKDLSMSYHRLGDLARARGDFDGAQMYYEQSLVIRKELSEKTGTVESRRNLAINYDSLGDIAKEKGELDASQRYHEKSLVIFEELSEETRTIELRRDLSLCCTRLGDTASAKGDFVEAHRYYEKALAISKELSDETGMIELRGDLSLNYERIGELAESRRDLPAAQEYYEKALSIRKELSEKTGAFESRRCLYIDYLRLGDIATARGNIPVAQAYYKKCLSVIEKLESETRSLQARRDLANVCFISGVFYYNNMHDPKKAKEMFKRIVELGRGSGDEVLVLKRKEAEKILDKYF